MNWKEETPPRAWGRPARFPCGVTLSGNTPTGVGKTSSGDRCRLRCWKHPHGRGEDPDIDQANNQRMETPPRAWGRHGAFKRFWNDGGNTPTGVGKTSHFLQL